MSVSAGQLQIDTDERGSMATLQRFAKPMAYERWAGLAATFVGMMIFWPFVMLIAVFRIWPNLNQDPNAFIYFLPLVFATAVMVRWFTRMASVTRRAVVRSGVVRSFKKAGKSTSGDFVGIAYSERILDLRRGVDWDYGFLELREDGLAFQGDRSHFLLSHDCIQSTELKQYRLSTEGWFVRLFVHWSGQSETPECFSLCFQDGGVPRPVRHELSETWRRRIDDWHWNSMGSPVPHAPELPIDSSPLDTALAQRAPMDPKLNKVAWVAGVACSLSVSLVLGIAALILGWDWAGGLVVLSIFYGPVLFRAIFMRVFARLAA